jgi:hypothetical protein
MALGDCNTDSLNKQIFISQYLKLVTLTTMLLEKRFDVISRANYHYGLLNAGQKKHILTSIKGRSTVQLNIIFYLDIMALRPVVIAILIALTMSLNCSNITYSTGVNKNSTACKCQSNFFFDSITQQCLPNTHSSHAVAIAVGIAVPLGVLALIACLVLLCLSSKPTAVPPPPIIPVPVSRVVAAPVSQVIPQQITSTRIVPTSTLPMARPIVSGYGGYPPRF